MYSLRNFGEMIADGVRLTAYTKAITSAVQPGDAVADLGCGPGLFALLACRAGARKVYAIDTESIVEVGRDLAKRNCFAEQIEFLQGDSRKIELPERANVVVSDIRGALPLFGHAVPSIEDARQRFLAPGGALIPERDTLKAAVIEANDYYSGLTSPWLKMVPGLDFTASLPMVLNSSYGGKFRQEQLLTDSQTWGVLDYIGGANACAAAELHFRAGRNGTAHGLCVWFETQLFGEIGYSSGPDAPQTIYGQIFFPLLKAVAVTEGQEIQVDLRADLVGGDYVWRWTTKIPSGGNGVGLEFQQSTFQGAVLSSHSLRRHAADHVPVLSEEGQADRWLLQAMDGKASLQEIAQQATKRFPSLFSCWDAAFQRAAGLSGKFSG